MPDRDRPLRAERGRLLQERVRPEILGRVNGLVRLLL